MRIAPCGYWKLLDEYLWYCLFPLKTLRCLIPMNSRGFAFRGCVFRRSRRRNPLDIRFCALCFFESLTSMTLWNSWGSAVGVVVRILVNCNPSGKPAGPPQRMLNLWKMFLRITSQILFFLKYSQMFFFLENNILLVPGVEAAWTLDEVSTPAR